MQLSLEAVGQHALGVHVGESQRADNLLHALAAAIVLDGCEEGTEHIDVVDEVEPSEAHSWPLPLLVVAAVDDGGHTSHHLPLLQGQIVLHVAEFKGGIRILRPGRKGLHLVAVEVGGVVGVPSVEVVMQLYELLQIVLVLYLLYLYFCHYFSVLSLNKGQR